MAAQRPADDPDTTTFEATVSWVDDTRVLLDATYFFAESGGQPADRGKLGDISVVDVTHTSDGIAHDLADTPPWEAGDTVTGAIDTTFRTYCQRAHTASHVMYGAARNILSDLGYAGFDITEEKIRIDFATSTSIDDHILLALEQNANQCVWESRPVTWESMTREEVVELSGVAFNSKTEEGVLDTGEEIRIVEIGHAQLGDDTSWWDRAACGGTHVRNTQEIGSIAVLDRSNPGNGRTRIEFAVGERAITHHNRLSRAAYEAAENAQVAIEDLPSRVDHLLDEQEALSVELTAVRNRLIEEQLSNATPREVREDERWIIETVDTTDSDILAQVARDTLDQDLDAVVLLSRERPVRLTIATHGMIDAGNTVDRLTDTLGGGGGGGTVFAQAGGIDTDPTRIIDALRE